MTLCHLKHILGVEGKGIHSFRLFNIAIVDVMGTVVAGWLLARFLKWNAILTIMILFLMGILMHRWFCVNTTVNKKLFGIL